ncbi:hypothetical protein DPV78_000069 [Talaromyces pinophilus]|nr:hypothetical protein DPV78_000069 [Talaromyces pinophilus]
MASYSRRKAQTIATVKSSRLLGREAISEQPHGWFVHYPEICTLLQTLEQLQQFANPINRLMK